MLQILGYLIFIITVAIAAAGVVLTSKLRNKYHHKVFSALVYYQAFIFAFGFYGIWGQALIRVYLSKYISAELLSKFSDFALLIGFPFLIFAWLMLLQFALQLSGRRNSNWFVLSFLAVNFIILVVMGYLMAGIDSSRALPVIKYYFISFQIIYSFIASSIILFAGKLSSLIHQSDAKKISSGILVAGILMCVPLVIGSGQLYLTFIFIFLFFSGNIFLPVYMNYGTLFIEASESPVQDFSLDEFCKKYDVSPRETDIVREICNGLSNQEIAEKLFISLQTVKDHTHRIYNKTNVRSRSKLIFLVKEMKEMK